MTIISRCRLAVATLFSLATVTVLAGPSQAAVSYDQNVTPDALWGTDNANGSFTVDRSNGVEIGLRGKLRHNAVGLPENTFNSNGDGTYTFKTGVAPTQSSPTATWSYEWSINTDYLGTSGNTLNDYTYELALDTDPGPGTSFVTFDPIHDPHPVNGYWDHSIGTNGTGNGMGTEAGNLVEYEALLANNNVAQNSWKPHWNIPGFNPDTPGEYTIQLTAFDAMGATVASSSIVINAVPEPSTIALAGLAGIAGVAILRRRRRG